MSNDKDVIKSVRAYILKMNKLTIAEAEVLRRLLGFLITKQKPFVYSNVSLAANCNCDPRTVRRAISKFRKMHLLETIGESFARRFQPGSYLHIIIKQLDNNSTQGTHTTVKNPTHRTECPGCANSSCTIPQHTGQNVLDIGQNVLDIGQNVLQEKKKTKENTTTTTAAPSSCVVSSSFLYLKEKTHMQDLLKARIKLRLKKDSPYLDDDLFLEVCEFHIKTRVVKESLPTAMAISALTRLLSMGNYDFTAFEDSKIIEQRRAIDKAAGERNQILQEIGMLERAIAKAKTPELAASFQMSIVGLQAGLQ